MTMDQAKPLCGHDAMFRLMIERTAMPVSIQDANWRFVFANQSYCDYVGYELKDLLGRDPSTFLFPSEGKTETQSYRDWAHAPGRTEFSRAGMIRELVRSDGSRVRFRSDMGHTQAPNGEDLWCGILFDLTEIDELRADLNDFEGQAKAMQMRFDSFAELSNEGMLVVDAHKDLVLHANTVIREVLGVEQVVIDQPFSALLSNVDPSDLERFNEMLLRGGSPRGTEEHVSIQHPRKGKRTLRIRCFSGSRPQAEAFVLVEDVTDQIRYEEYRLGVEVMKRETVVKEIHHRVHNQLHGVMNLLESSLLSADTKEVAIEKAIARISAIANLNGSLTRTSSDVSLLHLVVQIVDHAKKTQRNQIRIELVNSEPELKGINIDNNAVAIALVINDLLAQACEISSDDNVTVALEARRDGVQIQLTCRCNAEQEQANRSISENLGLATSLVQGTDSSIVFAEQEGDLALTLALGPKTLAHAQVD